jgi:hypothetical protein
MGPVANMISFNRGECVVIPCLQILLLRHNFFTVPVQDCTVQYVYSTLLLMNNILDTGITTPTSLEV